MTSNKDRPLRSSGRKLRIHSEPNHDLKPKELANILVTAGIDRARREAADRREIADQLAALEETEEAADD